MTDIQKMIEEEAISYIESLAPSDPNFDVSVLRTEYEAFIAGATFALSQLQHANRWRKFGTDELPEIGQIIVARTGENYQVFKLRTHQYIHWVCEKYVEWKPIT